MSLSDFLNGLLVNSNDGKEGILRSVFKLFDFPNHGIGISFLQEQLQEATRRNPRHVAINKMLGFNTDDTNKAITSVGQLLDCQCHDHFTLVKNQFKKWRFPRAYNKGVQEQVDLFPYWITLEFLYKFEQPITEIEFIIFVATIYNRSRLDLHVEMLKEYRKQGADFHTVANFTLPEDIPGRFSKSMWNHFFAHGYFEYIIHENETIKIVDTLEISEAKKQVELFYNYLQSNDLWQEENYLNFLQSPTVMNNSVFPDTKQLSLEIINDVASKLDNYFPYKNLLLKGVPGTGKSRFIDQIIKNKIFSLSEENQCLTQNELINNNVLRINVHSGTNNSELMQGISVHTNSDNQVVYSEKQGLVLNFILRAIAMPSLPFVIILEEVQENNLNSLIGDLIFLIEQNRRTKFEENHLESLNLDSISELTEQFAGTNKARMPSLVEKGKEFSLCVPDNLYFLCTSNYREDKKIMEDNLLRRFEVIEVFPDPSAIGKQPAVRNFFTKLNNTIIDTLGERGEIHPDRYQIGHAIWLDVNSPQTFASALNKLLVEFKDIKELDWSITSEILSVALFEENELHGYSYEKLVKELQDYYFFEQIVESKNQGVTNKIIGLFNVD